MTQPTRTHGLWLLAILLAVTASPWSMGQTTPSRQADADSTGSSQIVMLGTGTPNADPDRSGPSVAIVVNDTPYIVDVGPGVVRRAAAAYRAGVTGLNVAQLTRAFVTHLHSDHTIGYPDLILTPWVLDREAPLEIYGPEGLQDMTDHILAAYDQDIQIRLSGLQPITPDGYKVEVHEIEPGVIYEDANVTVEAIPVQHGEWSQAFAYKFVAPDRTIVISGDARPSDTLVEAARGCDVLIHEVYSQTGFERREADWQAYHAASHTSSHQLAELAGRIQPKLLILYHHLFWGTSEEDLLSEVQSRYDGRVISGKDLEVY